MKKLMKTNMSRYFEITFNDLDSEKKQELIEEVTKQLKEEWEKEAQLIGAVSNKKITWQDAYCEVQGIDDDLRDTDWTKWDYSVENYAEEKAEQLLFDSFNNLEVEVEV